tara:strand:+ start:120 stop:515 length:396 start_codon:yes stop_codon:yes gene_type:complete
MAHLPQSKGMKSPSNGMTKKMLTPTTKPIKIFEVMRDTNTNNNGAFEPHQRNLGEEESKQDNSTRSESFEGMGSLSAEDMHGLKDAIDKGYKHFARQTHNTKGQKVDRRHMLSPADQANFSYGKKDERGDA